MLHGASFKAVVFYFMFERIFFNKVLLKIYLLNNQKQPSRGVLRESCFQNMQQIYRRTPIPKCDFNKVAVQLIEITLRYGCSHVTFLHIFKHLFLRTPIARKVPKYGVFLVRIFLYLDSFCAVIFGGLLLNILKISKFNVRINADTLKNQSICLLCKSVYSFFMVGLLALNNLSNHEDQEHLTILCYQLTH